MTAPVAPPAIQVPKAGAWPAFGWFTLAFMVAAQGYAIVTSPADRDMGDLQKILYVHVPASWIMSITTRCSIWFFSLASSSFAARRSVSGSPVRGVVPASGCERTSFPFTAISSSGEAPMNPSIE